MKSEKKGWGRRPLMIWIVLAIISVLSIALMLVIDPRIARSERRANVVAQRLKKFESNSNEFVVLFIGNSLLGSALTETKSEIAWAPNTNGIAVNRPIRVINAVVQGGLPFILDALDEEVIRLRPDVVVLQFEIAVGHKNPQKLSTQLRLWSELTHQTISDHLRTELGIRKRKKVRQVPTAILVDTKRNTGIESLLSEPKKGEEYLRFKESDLTTSRRFLRKAETAGIQVIVLDTPVGPGFAYVQNRHYLERKKEAVQNLFAPKAARYIQFKDVLNKDCFVDPIHVNAKGREIFLDWFWAEFERVLQVSTSTRAAGMP